MRWHGERTEGGLPCAPVGGQLFRWRDAACCCSWPAYGAEPRGLFSCWRAAARFGRVADPGFECTSSIRRFVAERIVRVDLLGAVSLLRVMAAACDSAVLCDTSLVH